MSLQTGKTGISVSLTSFPLSVLFFFATKTGFHCPSEKVGVIELFTHSHRYQLEIQSNLFLERRAVCLLPVGE